MPHKVLLTWQEPPTSDPVGTFNIKRSSVSGGPYTTIGSVTSPTETFEDDNVSSGQTWFYVTTAVNASGESAPSPEVKAVIPFLVPQPPIGLVATVS